MRYDAVVVGGGLAGLAAARGVHATGRKVLVLEARHEIGGRVRSVRLGDEIADLGGEFVGSAHRRITELARAYGLSIESTGAVGRPVLWRLPSGTYRSRLPPAAVARDLARVLLSAARRSRGVDPSAPWAAPASARLDSQTVDEWVEDLGVGADARYVLDRLVTALSSAPPHDLSLLQFMWWMRLAGGPLRSIGTTFQARIAEGAQELARRMAADAGEVVADAIVESVEHSGDCRVTTRDGRTFTGRRLILAVPAPEVARIKIDPPPEHADEHAKLRIGPGTKVSALLPDDTRIKHNTVIGGEVLAAAWRTRRRVTGFAAPCEWSTDALAEDLAQSFGTPRGELRGVTVCRWEDEPYIPGCDVGFCPGEICRIGPTLRPDRGSILVAGAERSAWPNSMEGALESGQRAAADVLAELSSPCPA